jgi:GNAT superfamily N-acetyltransferase
MVKTATMISQVTEPEQLYNLISELYLHINNQDIFTADFTSICNKSGYKVIGKYVNNKLVAILGYRMLYKFAFGKYIYIDDLITLHEYRSRGYGYQLIKWIKIESKKAGYNQIHLDMNINNHLALKFYLNNGFQARAHHLVCQI